MRINNDVACGGQQGEPLPRHFLLNADATEGFCESTETLPVAPLSLLLYSPAVLGDRCGFSSVLVPVATKN